MSITPTHLYAPQPHTIRAQPTHLSVDPKGQRLAYANGTSIFLRSLDDPSRAVQYTGHTAPTTVARFSPSGFYVASGDAGGTVRVWDCAGEDQVLKGEYKLLSGRVNDVAWDGESARIIAVGDGKERFGAAVTADSGNSVGEILGHSAVINAVAMKPQRPFRAVTVSDDSSAVFFHGAPYKFNKQLKEHGNFVLNAAYAPDGSVFATVGSDRRIFMYDGASGDLLREVKSDDGHKGSIFGISFSADSKRFVTSSADQTVKLWDVESGELQQTWKFGDKVAPGYHQVGVVYTHRDDGLIVSLSLDGDLHYLKAGEDKPLRTIYGHQKALTAANLDESGKKLYTGSYDGQIRVWDLETGLASPVDGAGHSNQVIAIERAAENRLLTVGWDDTIRTIDVATDSFVGTPTKTVDQPRSFTAAPDGTFYLATATSLQHISPSASVISTFTLPSPPTSVTTSTSTLLLATESSLLHAYHHPLPSPLSPPSKSLPPLRSQPTHLAFSPDGKYFSAADTSGKILLYAASDFSVATSRWAFHAGRVNAVRWDPASKFVVSGGIDGNVLVYSVDQAGKKLMAKGAHRGGVSAVAWRGEGEAVSVGQDGTVRRWKVVLF